MHPADPSPLLLRTHHHRRPWRPRRQRWRQPRLWLLQLRRGGPQVVRVRAAQEVWRRRRRRRCLLRLPEGQLQVRRLVPLLPRVRAPGHCCPPAPWHRLRPTRVAEELDQCARASRVRHNSLPGSGCCACREFSRIPHHALIRPWPPAICECTPDHIVFLSVRQCCLNHSASSLKRGAKNTFTSVLHI